MHKSNVSSMLTFMTSQLPRHRHKTLFLVVFCFVFLAQTRRPSSQPLTVSRTGKEYTKIDPGELVGAVYSPHRLVAFMTSFHCDETVSSAGLICLRCTSQKNTVYWKMTDQKAKNISSIPIDGFSNLRITSIWTFLMSVSDVTRCFYLSRASYL